MCVRARRLLAAVIAPLGLAAPAAAGEAQPATAGGQAPRAAGARDPRAAGVQDPARGGARIPPSTAPAGTYEFTVTERRPVTASSTLTVPAADFELRPLESGGQMVEAVPGALTAQHAGGGKAEQYFLRGFDADHGTDLLVYFDGVPINLRSHAHGQGYLDLHFVTPETVERIDAWKGPYFPRFGDFATAAAVEYVPYAALPRSAATFEAGSWDTYRGVSLLSPRFGPFGSDDPSAEALVAFEAYRTDGPYVNDEDLRRYSLFARGSLQLSPALRLSGHALGYAGRWDGSGQIPDHVVDEGVIGRFGSLDPSEGGRSHRYQGKLQLDWSPREQARLTANAYVAHYDLDLFSNFTFELVHPDAIDAPVIGDGIVQKDRRVYAGGRVEYVQLVERWVPGRLRGGIEWRLDDAHVILGTQTNRQITGATSDDDVFELSAAPYGEAELLLLPWVRFAGGLRVEVLGYGVKDRLPGGGSSDGADRRWLPKANLVLSPFGSGGPWTSGVTELRDLELFLNFGRGFHSNDARTTLGDPDANPMTLATGAELGARTRLLERLTVAADGFWLALQDELVFVGDEGTTESAGRTRRLGVELVARAELTEWLYLRGDLAYTWPRLVSSDRPLPQAARFIGKGAVGVRFGGFAAELGVRSLGRRASSDDPHTPDLTAYTILDFGMRYRTNYFELGIDFENLADSEWRSSEFFFPSCPPSDLGVSPECPAAGGGAGIPDRHFTPGNPFNVRGWVSLRF
jgi:hypothetical protein